MIEHSQPDRLIGIAVRAAPREPMRCLERARIGLDFGVEGDHKGPKFPRRAVTILAIEDWRAALAALPNPIDLPWTARRANLLVDGILLPRAIGAILEIGSVQLEVTFRTTPCARMEEAAPGLLKALALNWRGGVTTKVLEGGEIEIGALVRVLYAPAVREMQLP